MGLVIWVNNWFKGGYFCCIFIVVYVIILLKEDLIVNIKYLFGCCNIRCKYFIVVFSFKVLLIVRYLRRVLLEVVVKLKLYIMDIWCV